MWRQPCWSSRSKTGSGTNKFATCWTKSLASQVKFGRDRELEEQADKLLSASVGANKRGVARDIEKMSYEHGFLSKEDLEHYDPGNDWDTQDEPSVWLIDAANIEQVPSHSSKRAALMRHVGDSDDWGPTQECIPPLG